jgi:signal transduction histidine kinase
MKGRLKPQDREYLLWLMRIERDAIVPLKWAILLITVFFWLWINKFVLPESHVFLLFYMYAMFTAAQTYFFHFRRVTVTQVKPFCYASYLVDILYVTLLVYFDRTRAAAASDRFDFYILYFLLILRGFALFRTAGENILMSVVISVLFILSIRFHSPAEGPQSAQNFALKFSLIWLVILMSWFIINLINKQKSEIMKVQEKLIRSEHLATLGEIAAGVAHEINNPIGIISAYAEYLRKRTDASAELKEDLETVYKEAQRCKRTVAELLNFARPAVNDFRECDLRTLNDEVLAFVFHDTEEMKIQIAKDYDDVVPSIVADPMQIKQALLNIYLNARQAMENGGKIRVFVGRGEKDSQHVRVIVQDDGVGVAEEDLERVFEPFFTRKKGGTGLGLSITRRIVEAHGGEISLRPAKAGGTVVEMTFPAK